MKLKILTEDTQELKSKLASGGYCNVLLGAKYAPILEAERTHLLKSGREEVMKGGCETSGGTTISKGAATTDITYVPGVSGTVTVDFSDYTTANDVGCQNSYALTIPATPNDLSSAASTTIN
jgi:hypothetical protein